MTWANLATCEALGAVLALTLVPSPGWKVLAVCVLVMASGNAFARSQR